MPHPKSHPPKSKSDHWGKRLRAVLKEKSVTLRKAASIAGVSASVLDSWTSGSSPSDLQAVRRLADELDVSFAWLLTGSPEKGHHAPTVAELFQEVPYFDGLARIRIDRLIPRGKKPGGEDGSK